MLKQSIDDKTDLKKKKITRGDKAKLVEVKMEMNWFGGLLYLVLQQKINMRENIASFLMSISLYLCDTDDKMNKTG